LISCAWLLAICGSPVAGHERPDSLAIASPTDKCSKRGEGLVIADFSLDGKVAVVTGAAVGGIGEAYASALAEAGAAVVCADVNEAGAKGVADAIVGSGRKAIAVAVDITDEASVQEMVRRSVGEFGGVDILVNNAALMAQIAVEVPTIGFTPEMWDRAFAVNVKGAWHCSRACAPEMVKRGGGSIINQSSIGALPAESVYGITKLAMIGLTTALARDLGRSNINVNCIAPGLTQSVAGKMLTPDDGMYAQMMKARAALRSKGQPEELCGALLLFASPAGRWITGQVLAVDGGITMFP
jgi:NAD(P)-dependent dehydrogenase (short-subunit alcohol dehydrogenase family)